VPSPVARTILDVFWRKSNRQVKRRVDFCQWSIIDNRYRLSFPVSIESTADARKAGLL